MSHIIRQKVEWDRADDMARVRPFYTGIGLKRGRAEKARCRAVEPALECGEQKCIKRSLLETRHARSSSRSERETQKVRDDAWSRGAPRRRPLTCNIIRPSRASKRVYSRCYPPILQKPPRMTCARISLPPSPPPPVSSIPSAELFYISYAACHASHAFLRCH